MANLRTICVFCGSSPGNEPIYMETARLLGEEMVRRNIGLVYGGGSVGLMGEVARTVHEGGVPVLGVIPSALAPKELSGDSIGELIIVDSMHERKALMAQRSDAFLTMPGGYGTMDELFEVVTWVQLGIQSKPVGLLNTTGYFDPIITWIELALAKGFLRAHHREILVAEFEPAALLDCLAVHEPPAGLVKWMDWEQT